MAERQEIDGIEDIGLAGTIRPHKAVDVGRERQASLAYVLIIEYRKMVQYHFCVDDFGVQK